MSMRRWHRCSSTARCLRRAAVTALLNYRHNISAEQMLEVSSEVTGRSVQYLGGEERTNYPLILSVE